MLLVALLTGGAAALVIHKRNSFKLSINREYLRYALVFSLPLILHGLASVFNGKVDAWFLMKLKDSGDAGIYSFAGNFGHVIYVLYTACNLAFIPWYYKKKAVEQDVTVVNLIKQYIGVFSFIFFCFLCVIPEVIDLLGTDDYEQAKYFVPGVALGFFFNFLYNFPTNYLFYQFDCGDDLRDILFEYRVQLFSHQIFRNQRSDDHCGDNPIELSGDKFCVCQVSGKGL